MHIINHMKTFYKKHKSYYLQDFTPNSRINEHKYYVKQLKHAIRKKNIHNIAISGGYGTGKSSILSHFKAYSLWNFIHPTKRVSFLTFMELDKSKKGEIHTRSVIQQEIFKQLFYGERTNLLHQSRYHRVNKNRHPIIFFAFSLIISALLAYISIESIQNYIPQQLQKYFSQEITSAILIIIYLILCYLVINLLANIFYFIADISEIKVKDISLELSKHKMNFEETLDEMIYFFKKTHYKVIILEDLDRFDSPTIYEDLHQLNVLLNNSKHIWRKITFVYALREDLILDATNRNKLFDINISILPFLSKETCREYVEALFSSQGIPQRSISNVAKVIARNIYDMRTIKAICNTTFTTAQLLDIYHDSDLSFEEATSMAIIREMYPKEYNLLRSGTSVIDAIYDNCNKNRRNSISTFTKALNLHDNPETIPKIVDAFWEYARQQPHKKHAYYELYELACDEYILHSDSSLEEIMTFWSHVYLKEESISLYFNYRDINYHQNVSSEFITLKLTDTAEKRRLLDLIYASKHTKDELNTKINILKSKEALSEFNHITLTNGLLEDKPILKELLKLGLIKDSYRLYITPKSKGGTNLKLRIFKSNYVNLNKSNYDYQLTSEDIEQLIQDSDKIDLSSVAFYNHDIFKWCFKNNKDKLQLILLAANNNLNALFDFYDSLCTYYQKSLRDEYASEYIGKRILKKATLTTVVDKDFILYLTGQLSSLYPSQTLHRIVNNLGDTIAREIIFDVAILSIKHPESIIYDEKSFPSKYQQNPMHYLNYYADYITRNGGSMAMSHLHVNNSIPVEKLSFYLEEPSAFNYIVSNKMFNITADNLQLVDTKTAEKILSDVKLSEATLSEIISSPKISTELKKFCIYNLETFLSERIKDPKSSKKITNFIKQKRVQLTYNQYMQLAKVGVTPNDILRILPINIQWEDLNLILSSMSAPYNSIQLGKRPTLPKTPENEKLLHMLENAGVIGNRTRIHNDIIYICMKQKYKEYNE